MAYIWRNCKKNHQPRFAWNFGVPFPLLFTTIWGRKACVFGRDEIGPDDHPLIQKLWGFRPQHTATPPNGTEKLKIICVYVPHCWAIRVSTSRAQGRGGRGFYLEIISLSISGGWASHLKNILWTSKWESCLKKRGQKPKTFLTF